MIIRKAEISAVAVSPSQYPNTGYSEIAFAGRSNVGKSSLINSLVNRRGLARTSGTPGKTRTINFYNINDEIHLVDLPGYGYAKVSKEEKAKWGNIIEQYLYGREVLKAVALLVDIRHEPTSDDKLMYDWIKHTGLPTIVIATKSDKLSKNQQFKNVAMVKKSLDIDKEDTFISFSSEKNIGREELWEFIENLCLPHHE